MLHIFVTTERGIFFSSSCCLTNVFHLSLLSIRQYLSVDEHTCVPVSAAQAALIVVQPYTVAGHHPLSSVSSEASRCYFSTANRAHAASPPAPQAAWLRREEKRGLRPGRSAGGALPARTRGSAPGRPGSGSGPATLPRRPEPAARLKSPLRRPAPAPAPAPPATGRLYLPSGPAAILFRLVPSRPVPSGQRPRRGALPEGGEQPAQPGPAAAAAAERGLRLAFELETLPPPPPPLPRLPACLPPRRLRGLAAGSGVPRKGENWGVPRRRWQLMRGTLQHGRSGRRRGSITGGQHDQRPNSHKRKRDPQILA